MLWTAPSGAVFVALQIRAVAGRMRPDEKRSEELSAMHIEGQCHCGLVTYEAVIDPEAVSICHCKDCQQLTGSPYRVTVLCSGKQIRLTGKPPKIYARRGENGHIRFQHFCPKCGSPLFTSGEGDWADDWGIRWGSIRQREQLKPARQIWCRSAAPWVNDLARLPARSTE
jgi:hypothetical protein